MFFNRKKGDKVAKLKLPPKELTSVGSLNREQLNILLRKQKYQNIVSKRVFKQADEALGGTEILLKSVGDISMEMDKHEQHINKTVEVSTEVGAFSKKVNERVEETVSVIEKTIDKAKLGEEAVQEVINSINVAYKTTEGMKEALTELSSKSKKISGIVDTIKGIAKTTHMLSLNANIEATKAGEYGRGFAVVAGEVKKLAQNSSKSADEIDSIINEISSVTEHTLSIVMSGLEKTIESTNKAVEASKAINDMMKSVEKTKGISQEIINAVKEQSDKNQYMISVIDELFQVSQTVKAFNENIAVNAYRQLAVLNTLKQTIGNLNQIAATNIEEDLTSKTTFIMTASEPETLDPAMVTDINTSNIISSINHGLVQVGSGVEVIGAIAKSWNLESDNVTWNFNLRKDMKFHNGRSITAKDVKYSFERLLSKELNSPNRWFLSIIKGAEKFYGGLEREVEGIVVNGDYNIKLILEYPYSSFINNLAHCSCSIVPREEAHNLSVKPIGAGPYKFVTMDKQKKEILLEKFNDYILGEALIDNVKISYNNSESNLEKFINKEIDYINANTTNLHLLKKNGYTIHKSECIGIRFIAFNFRSHNPIVSNREFRHAINYCVDKERIIKEAFGGMESTIEGVFPKSILSNNHSNYSRNLNKARELVKKSGINIRSLTIQIISNPQKEGTHYKIAEILAENLKEIGITLKVTEIPAKEYYKEENLRRSDMFIYGWLGDSGTADNFIEPLIDINNPLNRSKYDNCELLNLLNQIKKTKNPYKYKELLCSLENKILDDSPWITISNICNNYAYNDNVKGLKIHPLNFIKLIDIWKE